MEELPHGDPRRELMQEARYVARLPRKNQQEWLEQLRQVFAAHPKREEILHGIDVYMQTVRSQDSALEREADLVVPLETRVLNDFEELLFGSKTLPQGSSERVQVIAKITLLGHLLPNLRERMAKDDAQIYLNDLMVELFTAPAPEGRPGHHERNFRERYVTHSRLQEIIDSIEHITCNAPLDAPEWMIEEAKNLFTTPPTFTIDQVNTGMHDEHFDEPCVLLKGFSVRLLGLWLERLDSRRPNFLKPKGPDGKLDFEEFGKSFALALEFRFRPVWKDGDPPELQKARGILSKNVTHEDLEKLYTKPPTP